MSVKTEHHQSHTSYFCTFTCHRWMNLFSITEFYDEIYKWFDIMVALKYHIVGYVIMHNHVHFIIHSPRDRNSLNKRVGTGKRFMAYEIVTRLEKLKQQDILQLLSEGVKASDRR